MKKILIMICLFASVSAMAQDTVKNERLIKWYCGTPSRSQSFIIVDGKKFEGESPKLNPDSIKSVVILDAKSAVSQYGEQGKHGAIIVTTKAAKNDVLIQLDAAATFSKAAKPLFIIDGVKSDSTAISRLNPNEIEKFEVLKDAKAIGLYGADGKKGVVLVSTKAGKNIKPTTITLDGDMYPRPQPLYMVDGVKSDSTKVKAIDPKDIESINVLNGASASAQYGEDGKNGVIQVTTKAGLKDLAAKVGKEYLSKFAKFSKEYKSYLMTHKSDDSRLIYFIYDGTVLSSDKAEDVKQLNMISEKEIDNIIFSPDSQTATGNKPGMVSIKLKTKN